MKDSCVAIIAVNDALAAFGCPTSPNRQPVARINRQRLLASVRKTGRVAGLAALLIATVTGSPLADAQGNHHLSVSTTVCDERGCGAATLLVWDGDSFLLDHPGRRREKIRIENIDAPEIDARCQAESEGARQAKEELASLLKGNVIHLARMRFDRYGRHLARLRIGEADIGETLIARGLVRRWSGSRQSWCGS